MVKIENKYGEIIIDNSVLANMVGFAATSCYGVVGMASRNAADGIVSMLKRENYEKGVKVDVINDKLQIELHIVVLYGVNLRAITESIVHKVKYSIEELSGFSVGDVTVFIDGMKA